MKATDRSGVVRFSEARMQVPAGEQGVKLLRRETLDLKLNVLRPPNKLATHEHDEIYIVVSGQGVFVHDGRRDTVGPGDFLFVAAGVEHVFEDFEELTLWRLYYGPKGGEVPA